MPFIVAPHGTREYYEQRIQALQDPAARQNQPGDVLASYDREIASLQRKLPVLAGMAPGTTWRQVQEQYGPNIPFDSPPPAFGSTPGAAAPLAGPKTPYAPTSENALTKLSAPPKKGESRLIPNPGIGPARGTAATFGTVPDSTLEPQPIPGVNPPLPVRATTGPVGTAATFPPNAAAPAAPAAVPTAGQVAPAEDPAYPHRTGFDDQFENSLLAAYPHEFSFSPDDWMNSPGYDFLMDEGTRAIMANRAGRGMLQSGATQRELARYGQGLAAQEYNNAYARANSEFDRSYNIWANTQGNRFNRLASLAGLGQTSVNNVNSAASGFGNFGGNVLYGGGNRLADLQGNLGDVQGSAFVARNNAWQQGFNPGGYIQDAWLYNQFRR